MRYWSFIHSAAATQRMPFWWCNLLRKMRITTNVQFCFSYFGSLIRTFFYTFPILFIHSLMHIHRFVRCSRQNVLQIFDLFSCVSIKPIENVLLHGCRNAFVFVQQQFNSFTSNKYIYVAFHSRFDRETLHKCQNQFVWYNMRTSVTDFWYHWNVIALKYEERNFSLYDLINKKKELNSLKDPLWFQISDLRQRILLHGSLKLWGNNLLLISISFRAG